MSGNKTGTFWRKEQGLEKEERNKHVNMRKLSLKHEKKKGSIEMKEVNVNEESKWMLFT